MSKLVTVFVMVMAAACGHAGVKPIATACTSDNADPGACLAMARDRAAKDDEAGTREYMEKLVVAINAAPACLRDHEAAGCFAGVVALLREQPVGLLARYDVPTELLELAPRWTGSESTGRRVQARTALAGMCATPGRDPVEQQRACLVLGDLVEDERMKRCGPTCGDKAEGALGWTSADVIDGYAAACKIDKTRIDAARQRELADEIARVYKVRGDDASCAVARSELRGASIPGALVSMARIREDAKNREGAAALAAKREAVRIAAMEKSNAANAAAAKQAEDAAFRKQIGEAIAKSDWPTTFGLLTKRRGSALDHTVATELQNVWGPFSTWAIEQSSLVSAFGDLSSRIENAPAGHALLDSLAGMRVLALAEARKTAKGARGVGGAWLHAALIARIAGPDGTAERQAAVNAYAKLVAATRVSLNVEKLAPACLPLVETPPGRAVRAKSTLACTLEPERKGEAGQRTFRVSVHGALTITRGAPPRTVPIDIEVVVDDTDGTDTRSFDMVRDAAIELVRKSVIAPIEAEDAQKALASGQRALEVKRIGAAENHLVMHALLAGSSPELDELLGAYGVSFTDLLP